jgi:hypothetical protein
VTQFVTQIVSWNSASQPPLYVTRAVMPRTGPLRPAVRLAEERLGIECAVANHDYAIRHHILYKDTALTYGLSKILCHHNVAVVSVKQGVIDAAPIGRNAHAGRQRLFNRDDCPVLTCLEIEEL